MTSRIEPLHRPPIGFAHRGARAHSRDNTIESFVLARRLGAAGLETDAWLTADGEVVLDHDGMIGRRPFRRPLGRFARADLPAHIPTLAELYGACGADYELSIDVKDDAAAAAIVSVARDHGLVERVWLCHPDVEVLAGWRSLGGVRLVHSTKLSVLDGGPERHAARLAEAGIDAVNLREPEWTGGLTTLFHRFEVRCLGWDAQYERQLDRLVDLGIDGLYSDHVDRMVEVFRRFGYPPPR